MKFINLNFIFNLTTVFLILLISFSTYSQLPGPQRCEDQGEYENDENTSLYCVVCDTDYNKPTFLELYGDNKKIYLEDIEYEIKLFSKSEVEKDRGMKSFCKTGEMIPIGTLYIEPKPDPKLDPDHEIEFTDDDQSPNDENIDQENNNNNNNNVNVRTPETSKKETNLREKIQDDLLNILNIINTNKELHMNLNILTFKQSLKAEPVSFITRYLQNLKDRGFTGSMNDINNQIGKLEIFLKQKNQAKDIYNNLLYNCGPKDNKLELQRNNTYGKEKKYKCKEFLKGSTKNGISNEDNFREILEFLKPLRGFIDNENDGVMIVEALINFFKDELSKAGDEKNKKEEAEKNFEVFTKKIQKYLAEIGYLDIKQIDGDYGPATDKAVDKWRNERGNPNKTGKIEENSQEFKLLETHYEKRIERLAIWQKIKSDVIKYFDFLGYKTKNLEKTIKKFQKDYDLEVTGSFFDKQSDEQNDTFDKLKEEYQNKNNKKNEVLSEVKNIQIYLQLLGFYSGEIDGDLGKGTIKAIKEWENKNNTESLIKEDESLDKKVLKKLRNNYEEIL